MVPLRGRTLDKWQFCHFSNSYTVLPTFKCASFNLSFLWGIHVERKVEAVDNGEKVEKCQWCSIAVFIHFQEGIVYNLPTCLSLLFFLSFFPFPPPQTDNTKACLLLLKYIYPVLFCLVMVSYIISPASPLGRQQHLFPFKVKVSRNEEEMSRVPSLSQLVWNYMKSEAPAVFLARETAHSHT